MNFENFFLDAYVEFSQNFFTKIVGNFFLIAILPSIKYATMAVKGAELNFSR